MDIDIDYIHAFTYSERENTPAALMEGVVPIGERRARSKRLRQLSMKKKQAFYTRHLGQARDVLFEKGPDENTISGYSDNYVRVVLPYDESLINTLAPVELQKITGVREDIFVKASLALSNAMTGPHLSGYSS